ncbi:MAG: DUF3011 domain-containing protein [Acidobacteria bacterium]|nr:DUF3011 domain-containing protein [Acidobacteriota bacterium]MBS1866215.1 DUF3011 domain-containing protein [Acidobacteriota bacterium]
MRKIFALSGLFFAILLPPALSNSSGTALAAMPGPRVFKLYCASNDYYRHFCPINAYGGVELLRQKSESPCVYGRTWGVAGDSIWVDRGCRADFAVGVGEYFRDDDDYRVGMRTFYCASDDYNVHGCRVDTYGGVRLIRQRSEAPCVYGRTWGFDERGVWVDRGCRADFAVGNRRGYYDRNDWRR